jgi:hypothetical protein
VPTSRSRALPLALVAPAWLAIHQRAVRAALDPVCRAHVARVVRIQAQPQQHHPRGHVVDAARPVVAADVADSLVVPKHVAPCPAVPPAGPTRNLRHHERTPGNAEAPHRSVWGVVVDA